MNVLKFSKIGVLIADTDEYDPLLSSLPFAESIEAISSPFPKCGQASLKGTQVLFLCSGIGKVNAAAAAMYLILKGCDCLINFGYSGGIAGVKRGDLVVNDRFFEHDFDLTVLGYPLSQKPGEPPFYPADDTLLELFLQQHPQAVTGAAVTGDSFICDSKKRQKMKEEFHAVSCDMETAGIASVCNRMQVPLLVFRKISDDAGEDASVGYRNTLKTDDSKPGEILAGLFGSLT